MKLRRYLLFLSATVLLGIATACHTSPRPGTIVARGGDEIVVAGQFIHTGTRVVTWMDPGGYDAYRVERRFAPAERASWETSTEENKELTSPNRYNLRSGRLSDEEVERVRGGGWDLATLQRVVDQFVLHYDACGTSRKCFEVLHDYRNLSVHFMLDLDGTIYQTLDVKERAWHATSSNSRSVGIEIANLGAYAPQGRNPFSRWYAQDEDGRTCITIPEEFGDGGLFTRNFSGRPARPEPVAGNIQGQELQQFDFTPEQYRALIHLTAALCKTLPRIMCDYPRAGDGRVISEKLDAKVLERYQGVLGHFHVQTNKVDPGPAFQWDYVINNARRLLNDGMSDAAERATRGHKCKRD